jgi:hypothetical protein
VLTALTTGPSPADHQLATADPGAHAAPVATTSGRTALGDLPQAPPHPAALGREGGENGSGPVPRGDRAAVVRVGFGDVRSRRQVATSR